jgi:uncharacterized protein (TIGR02466 family)
MKIGIEEIFTTPILIAELDLDLNKIIDYCYSYKNNFNGRNVSNYGGYQSNDIDISEKSLIDLKTSVNNVVSYIGNNILNTKDNLKISNVWFNINNYKDFNIPHKHSFSILSCVFYAKVPENSGRLVFHNDYEIPCYLEPGLVKATNKFNSIEKAFNPKNNSLFIFPSWISHFVEPNMSKEDRISFAFNTNF